MLEVPGWVWPQGLVTPPLLSGGEPQVPKNCEEVTAGLFSLFGVAVWITLAGSHTSRV